MICTPISGTDYYYANLEVRGQNLTGTRYATFSFDSMSNRFEQRGAPRYFEFALRRGRSR